MLIVILIFKFLPTMEDKGLSSAFVNQEVAIEAGVTSYKDGRACNSKCDGNLPSPNK